ncbi:unnamed protein product [Lampetra planeri]
MSRSEFTSCADAEDFRVRGEVITQPPLPLPPAAHVRRRWKSPRQPWRLSYSSATRELLFRREREACRTALRLWSRRAERSPLTPLPLTPQSPPPPPSHANRRRRLLACRRAVSQQVVSGERPRAGSRAAGGHEGRHLAEGKPPAFTSRALRVGDVCERQPSPRNMATGTPPRATDV